MPYYRQTPTVSSDLLNDVQVAGPLRFDIAPFGLTAGITTIEQGLLITHAFKFSSVVLAGTSQPAMIEPLDADAPLAIAVSMAVAISLRTMIYSAFITPYLRDLTTRSKAFALYLLTDQTYTVSIARYDRDDEADRFTYYVGAGVSL